MLALVGVLPQEVAARVVDPDVVAVDVTVDDELGGIQGGAITDALDAARRAFAEHLDGAPSLLDVDLGVWIVSALRRDLNLGLTEITEPQHRLPERRHILWQVDDAALRVIDDDVLVAVAAIQEKVVAEIVQCNDGGTAPTKKSDGVASIFGVTRDRTSLHKSKWCARAEHPEATHT